MAKGSGSKGGKHGTGGVGGRSARSSSPKEKFQRAGIRGQSISDLFPLGTRGMRDQSLAFLRGGGKASNALPVTLQVDASGKVRGVDGRHRITVARERGDKTIRGVVQGIGPRGGVKWKWAGEIPI